MTVRLAANRGTQRYHRSRLVPELINRLAKLVDPVLQFVDLVLRFWIPESRRSILVENPPPPEQTATMIAIRIRLPHPRLTPCRVRSNLHQGTGGDGKGSISRPQWGQVGMKN